MIISSLQGLQNHRSDEGLVFHYTSLDSFIKILDSNEIRMSHLGYLNDSREISQGLSIFQREISNCLENEELRITKLMEELLGYFISDHKPDIYAASFSRRGDLLSQWRGYAPNGGLSFGIELDRLKSIDDDRFYHVEECIYDDVKSHLKSKIKARELVQVILDKATYLKTGQIPDHSEGVEISNNKMARLRELDSEIAKNIFKLYALSASIKDNSFSEEQEVRIISHLLGEREVCFRATDKLLIPYTSFGIEDIEIKKIYVSPGIDFELNYNSIVKYFMINGRPVPDICPSSSSYRG